MAFVAPPRVAFGKPADADRAPPCRTKAERRRQYAAKLAGDLLPVLPEPGEAIHCLMGGNYDLGQVVCAILSKHPVRSLRIATLAYSKRTVAELFAAKEKGRIGTLTLLVSGFFERHNKELFQWVSGELADHPGSRQAAARSHCKVVCFEFADGSMPMTFEGSANLRKNGDREQLTAFRDRPLHDWHAGWIDSLVDTHDRD